MGDEQQVQGQEATQGGGCPPLPANEYAILGEDPFFQVSPEASFWAEGPILRTLTIKEVVDRLGSALRDYPQQPTAEEKKALTDTFSFAKAHVPFSPEQRNALGDFLTHPAFIARPPAGTVVNNRIREGRLPIVLNGAELATLFEAEKTAVWHQHVLLTLMDMPVDKRINGKLVKVRLREVMSPVRQALMQAALHMATLSALTVMWFFKWRSPPASVQQEQQALRKVSRRQRPAEYYRSHPDPKFRVLFDYEIRFDADGNILRDIDKREVPDLPGSPRHPAYGSGHSVYSKAASDILKVFLPREWGPFRDIPGSLDKLANSIGFARLWGGVHWLEDHRFGQDVGKVIAELIKEQLKASLVNPVSTTEVCPPTVADLNAWLDEARKNQGQWPWEKDGAQFPDDKDLGIQGGRVSV